jgi:hypothetical protein
MKQNLSRLFTFLSIATLLTRESSFADKHGHKEHTHGKHVHGAAELTLAVNGANSLQIEFHVPAESIFGFEHAAKTEKDKKTVQSALEQLKTTLVKMITTEGKAVCTASDIQTEHELEGHEEKPSGDKKNHGEHSEVHGEFRFNCNTPVSGQKFKISPKVVSSKIDSIEVTIIGESSQTSIQVKKSGGSVSIP